MSNWYIASEENIEYLAHYGVKGMKWRHKIGRAFRNVFGDNGTTVTSYHKYGDKPSDVYRMHYDKNIQTKIGPKEANGSRKLLIKDSQTTKGKYGQFTGDDSKEKYRDAREAAIKIERSKKAAKRKAKIKKGIETLKSKVKSIGKNKDKLGSGSDRR